MTPRWFVALALLFSAALPSCAQTEPQTAPRVFDPAKARAFMDSVALDNPARITPHWSADGSKLAYTYEGGWRVHDAGTGAMLREVSAGELERALGDPEAGISVSIDAEDWAATLEVGDAAWSAQLEDELRPTQSEPRDRPATVRKMFPMWGYDRRENLSPTGEWFASLKGPDLAVRRYGASEAQVLTKTGDPHVRWFHGNDIWENSGSIWSPDGSRFIARLHDAGATPGLLSLDYLSQRETVTDFRYWGRAGDPLPVTSLHVVEPAQSTTMQLGSDSGSDGHLFFIEWSPEGDQILAIAYSRDLKHQRILALDAETGGSRTLVDWAVEDGWTKWPGGPRTIRHIPGGGYLLRTDESGYFQYYRLNEAGERELQLTDGAVDVGDVIGFGPDGVWLYYLSPVSKDRPYDQVPHRVRLSGGAPERLSELDGQHNVTLSPDGAYLVSVHSDTNRPSRTDLLTSDGRFLATLASMATPEDLNGSPLPERVIARAADGETLIHGMILKPRGFDPAKSYPVIHRVYGAMQSRVVRQGFWPEGLGRPGGAYNLMLNYLTDAGYVVVLLDPPGTPGRGRDYLLAHHGTWPGTMPDDQVAALQSLAESRPWMDMDRVGIDGNSWGGYVALYSALERPDMYKTVSINVPEIDFVDHAHWIEWQIGTVDANPEAYERGGLHKRAEELESDLIIVAGTSDANVPVSNTMKLLDALAEAGKPYDLVILPGVNHSLQGRGDRYAYAVERIRAHHDAKLKPTDADDDS